MSDNDVPSNNEILWLSKTSGTDEVLTGPSTAVEPVSTDGAPSALSPPTTVALTENKSIDQSMYCSLDPRHVQAERFVAMIVSIVLSLLALVGVVIVGFSLGFTLLWLGITTGILLLLVMLILFMFFWPPISHRHVRWKLDEIGLEIQRGVYWQKTLSVPLARLQHADLTQGPIQRQWGLAKLTVHTAGTENASVELDGLAYETAVELRDRLLRQQGVVDVV
ncbi:MAG: PH domain-containing protein [Planctomycetaceae bacterium]|nr:PH domain-containing protein [Planctomycetaceae bacterium]